MRKQLLTISLLGLLLSSCKKETPHEVMPSSDPSGQKHSVGIGPVPTGFTRKAFIENFTGASYNLCPETDAMVQNMLVNNPGNVIVAAIHEGDQMEIPYAQYINWRFNNGSTPPIPSFMISRIPVGNNVFLSSQQLPGATNKNMNMIAKCGLAIQSTLYGRKAAISVHTGFSQVASGTNNLTVYLVENYVSKIGKGYDQLNSYNNVQSSPFYKKGDPIIGYLHRNVVRMVLTSEIGNTISSSKCVPGGHEIQNFTIDIPGYIDLNQAYIIGFVNKVGATPTTHEVLNAQIAKLGAIKNWD